MEIQWREAVRKERTARYILHAVEYENGLPITGAPLCGVVPRYGWVDKPGDKRRRHCQGCQKVINYRITHAAVENKFT